MADPFETFRSGLDDPATTSFAITPHDSNALTATTRAIYIGGDGNVTCRLRGDSTDAVFNGLKAGSILPVRATHVRSTGTSSSMNLVGLY